MEINIRKLTYFVEVSKHKNFTTASQNLFISQSLLSKVIKQMENELGVKLIDRTSKHFRLTDMGERFYVEAVNLLDHHSRLMNFINDDNFQGEVSISIPATILNLYFPQLLVSLRAKYTGIRLNIFEEGSKAALESVLSGKSDLAVVMLPVNPSDIDVDKLLLDSCVVAVHSSHPLSSIGKAEISQLENENFIIFNNQFVLHDMVIHLCHNNGFVPNIVYQSSLDSFIIEMVRLNQGIAILPSPVIAANNHQNISVINLEPVIPWQVALIARKGKYQSYAVRTIKQSIKNHFDTIQKE